MTEATINDDVGFLRALANDIEDMDDPMSDEIASRLRLLSDRLEKLSEMVQAVAMRAQIIQALRGPNDGDLIPEDYHCGDPTCGACEDAAASRQANNNQEPAA